MSPHNPSPAACHGTAAGLTTERPESGQREAIAGGKALKQHTKQTKKERLFGKTDYMVKEVNLLVVLGANPAELATFHPDRGIEID